MLRGWRWCVLLVLALSQALGAATPAATVAIPFAGVFPESMTVTDDGDLVFSALQGNRILRARPGQPQASPWITVPGVDVSIYGVLADASHDALWACIVIRRDGELKTRLDRYALGDGAFVSSTLFPGRGRCNDMAVGASGQVFATDIEAGRLLMLEPGTGALTVLLDDAAFRGIDGIAWMGGALYANNFRTGTLMRIQLDGQGQAPTLVQQRLSRPLEKPDGMRVIDANTLLLAEGAGRLAVLRVCGVDCFQVDTLADGLDGPTGVALGAGLAWVVEGQLRYRADPVLKSRPPAAFTARGFCMDSRCR